MERHKDSHKTNGQLIRDSIIGFSDGITVPFALTAGLSSLGDSKVVILGGLAELFAGSISMGLGAFLAAVTEKKQYEVAEAKQKIQASKCLIEQEESVYEIFDAYGISRHDTKGVVDGLKVNEDMMVQVRSLSDRDC